MRREPQTWLSEYEAKVRAEIDRLHAEHPVERCDLFRTVTGKCTCPPTEGSRR